MPHKKQRTQTLEKLLFFFDCKFVLIRYLHKESFRYYENVIALTFILIKGQNLPSKGNTKQKNYLRLQSYTTIEMRETLLFLGGGCWADRDDLISTPLAGLPCPNYIRLLHPNFVKMGLQMANCKWGSFGPPRYPCYYFDVRHTGLTPAAPRGGV